MDEVTEQEAKSGFAEGLLVAAAQNFTRALVNEPGNVLTPTELGARAKAMCDEAGLACQIHSSEKIRELKMEAFWAFARAWPSPRPRRHDLRACRRSGPGSPVLGLVGKGITFDTGGISIKPADGMEKMKYDMGGAAAADRHDADDCAPETRGQVIAACENMPSGRAIKPGRHRDDHEWQKAMRS